MKKGCVVKSAFLKLELSIQGDLRSRVCDRQKVENIVICKLLQQNVNKRVRKIELSNFDASFCSVMLETSRFFSPPDAFIAIFSLQKIWKF